MKPYLSKLAVFSVFSTVMSSGAVFAFHHNTGGAQDGANQQEVHATQELVAAGIHVTAENIHAAIALQAAGIPVTADAIALLNAGVGIQGIQGAAQPLSHSAPHPSSKHKG